VCVCVCVCVCVRARARACVRVCVCVCVSGAIANCSQLAGCTKYYNNFAKDTWAMFCLWGPADCILFSLPIWLRMPSRHVVSFGWTAYVSFLRGKAIPATVEDKKQ
jgi:hypothetical protein